MRYCLLLLSLLSAFQSVAQNGYNYFEQGIKSVEWQYLGPTNEENETKNQRFGHVSCISVNPNDSNEIYIGSPTGALMHTLNRGKSWIYLTDNCDLPIIGINDVIVDYSKKPHVILIATGTQNEWYNTATFGIFKSIDGGESWVRKTKQASSVFSGVYDKFDFKGNKLFVSSTSSIEFSTDFGETWQTILSREQALDNIPFSQRDIRFIYFEPSSNKLFFSTKQKWLSSGNESARLFSIHLNKNNSIEELTPKLTSTYKTEVANNGFGAIQIVPLNSERLLFFASHYNSRETFCYTYNIAENKIIDYEVPNAGNLPSSLDWFTGFCINKNNPRIRYMASILFYKSTDGGQMYEPLFDYGFGDNNVPHVDIRSIIIAKHSADGQNDHIYIGTDGGLSFSSNSGKSWENLNGQSLQLTQFYGLGTSEFTGAISAGSQDNSIITYLPSEKKWIYNVRGDGYDVVYDKNTPGKAYGQYNNRVIQSTSNDIVPFSRYMGLPPDGNSNNRKTLTTHPNGDLFFASQSLHHLPKGETKWRVYPTPLTHKALAIAVSKKNPEVIYMSGLWSDLIKSTDGGKNWEVLTDKIILNGVPIRSRIMSICVSPYDVNRIWIGLGYMGAYDDLRRPSSQLLESRDGGMTWQDASDGLPVFSIQDIVFHKGTHESIFAATDQGVYFRRGSGYKWVKYGINLPKTLIGELEINYCRGKLLAATYGRGLWEADLPEEIDENPLTIRRKEIFTAAEGEAKVVNRNIRLKKRGTLVIDCPLYMPKNGKIKVRNKRQISFTQRGKIINGCNEKFEGIVEK